jgi:hypothetical protein
MNEKFEPAVMDFSFQEHKTCDPGVHTCTTFRNRVAEEEKEWEE